MFSYIFSVHLQQICYTIDKKHLLPNLRMLWYFSESIEFTILCLIFFHFSEGRGVPELGVGIHPRNSL